MQHPEWALLIEQMLGMVIIEPIYTAVLELRVCILFCILFCLHLMCRLHHSVFLFHTVGTEETVWSLYKLYTTVHTDE